MSKEKQREKEVRDDMCDYWYKKGKQEERERILNIIYGLKKEYKEDVAKVGYRLTRDKIYLGYNTALKDIKNLIDKL
jgi:hypothetical protein